jgi:predicted GNAT family acetyltransferase
MPGAVRDNGELGRFELEQDGHLAVAHYRLAEGVITFMHTEVPSELSGRGMGSRLIAGALDEARRRGLKVTAECPFVSGFIAKHPEYRDLPKTAEA